MGLAIHPPTAQHGEPENGMLRAGHKRSATVGNIHSLLQLGTKCPGIGTDTAARAIAVPRTQIGQTRFLLQPVPPRLGCSNGVLPGGDFYRIRRPLDGIAEVAWELV